ncbi:sulfatase [Pirellulaceae bacterium]|nr:sulfatase [Pirellulaceae bacterium]
MTSTIFHRTTLLTLICSIHIWEVICHGAAQEKRPNLVFVIADDCTFDDVGCYGGQARTPNIDKIAKSGMRLTRCFQAAPMCSPTRHNIYTGLYPVRSGAYPNHAFAKSGTKSVVHYLRKHGYRVALSGKRHIAPREVFPFEYSIKKKNPDFDRISTLFSECSQTKTPFCLFVCSNEPHSPWDKGDASRYPPEKLKLPTSFVDTPQTRDAFSRYLAEITFFDQQVGKVVDLLRKNSLTENTLLMVTSEQGNSFPFAKWTLYDAGIQTAMIASWPDTIPANSTSNAMVEYVDVLPTFLDAAGATPAEGLDGKSFLPVLRGQSQQHKTHVYGIMTTRGVINSPEHYGIRSIRSDRFKLIWNLTPKVQFTNACTQSMQFRSWVKLASNGDLNAADKVKRYQWRPSLELYDIVNDPKEWNNLASDPSMQSELASLKTMLNSWMKSQGDMGQATELAALEHQTRSMRRKNPDKNNQKGNN